MNSYKIIKVVADSNKSELGLGDYIRIVSFIPNLKYEKLIWISNKELLPLMKNIEFIDRTYPLNQSSKKMDASFTINLFEKRKNRKNCLYIKNFFSKNKNIKDNTQDIYKKLANYFKFKNYKIFTNKKSISMKKYDFFLNWIVPPKWKIKEYPMEKWIRLCKLLKRNNKKVIWQKPNDSLSQYVNKITRSKNVISIVGLGCHISTLYGIPTVIISGPTYYNEAKYHKQVKIVFPNVPCKYTPCKSKKLKKHCGNMKHIDVKEIIKNINL